MSLFIVEKAVTRIECADINESPDEFQIFSVLIEAFCISDIDFYSADTAAHFSCQYSIGDFGKPFFAEIRVSVITIKACNGQHHPLTIIALICFIVGNRIADYF